MLFETRNLKRSPCIVHIERKLVKFNTNKKFHLMIFFKFSLLLGKHFDQVQSLQSQKVFLE